MKYILKILNYFNDILKLDCYFEVSIIDDIVKILDKSDSFRILFLLLNIIIKATQKYYL